MSAIDAALRKIRRDIPIPILNAAFIDNKQRLFGSPSSVDNEIVQKVLRAVVIPDISQFGQYIEVDITNCRYEIDPLDQFKRIYYLDEMITGGRRVIAAHLAVLPISAQSYQLPPPGAYEAGTASGVLSSTQKVIDSNMAIPRLSSSECRPVGPNAIEVRDPGMFSYTGKLMAKMEFSEDLNEIKPAFHPLISTAAVWAVKQYVYNQLSLDLDVARLENGVAFDRFKDFVDEYRDAGQTYDDYLVKVQAGLVHNDDTGNRRNFRSGGRFST